MTAREHELLFEALKALGEVHQNIMTGLTALNSLPAEWTEELANPSLTIGSALDALRKAKENIDYVLNEDIGRTLGMDWGDKL